MSRPPIFILIILTAFTACFFIAHAQSDALQSAVAGVSESVTKLATPATSSIDELTTRRDALIKIFDLSLTELKDLKKKLSISKINVEPEVLVVRDELLSDLDLFSKHVMTLKQDAVSATSSDDIAQMALDFKTWRADVYDPRVHLALDLTFLFQGKAVLRVADARFERVAADVSRLDKEFGVGAKRLKAYLALAADDLKQARNFYADARELFLGFFKEPLVVSPELTIEATSSPASVQTPLFVLGAATSSTSTPTSTSTQEAQIAPVTVQSLLKQSLDRVADAYRIFVEMSKLAKKLLSTTP